MIRTFCEFVQCDPICTQADYKTVETVSKSFNMCKCSDHDQSQNLMIDPRTPSLSRALNLSLVLKQYEFLSVFTSVNSPGKAELHLQATCYVSVLGLRSVLLKLPIVNVSTQVHRAIIDVPFTYLLHFATN